MKYLKYKEQKMLKTKSNISTNMAIQQIVSNKYNLLILIKGLFDFGKRFWKIAQHAYKSLQNAHRRIISVALHYSKH